jgi:hypothetical protein
VAATNDKLSDAGQTGFSKNSFIIHSRPGNPFTGVSSLRRSGIALSLTKKKPKPKDKKIAIRSDPHASGISNQCDHQCIIFFLDTLASTKVHSTPK